MPKFKPMVHYCHDNNHNRSANPNININNNNTDGTDDDTPTPNSTNNANLKIGVRAVNKTKSRKQKEKKQVTGLNNWALLCSTLKKDPCSRKKPKVEELNADEEPLTKKAKPDIWFDDVDESLLESDDELTKKGKSVKIPLAKVSANAGSLVKRESFQGKTKCIGMDCEMVGTGTHGEESVLARVSLVNIYGHCLYDKYVKPSERVTDYRTAVSGVTKELLEKEGEPFLKVQKEVSDLIHGAVLVGHALQNDLRVLYLSHPYKDIRDTSSYAPYRQLFDGKIPSLKKLSEKLLGVTVQEGEHSSVEDAQAAMRLYTMQKKKWEKMLKDAHRLRKMRSQRKKKKGSAAPTEESE